MSRGQKRRVPANFPRMKYRARKRRPQWRLGFWSVRVWNADGSDGWVPLGCLADGVVIESVPVR